jgi:hypothetical protein
LLLQKELKAGAYNPTPNWIAIIIIPIVQQFVAIWFLLIPGYFLIGFENSVDFFFEFCFLLFL